MMSINKGMKKDDMCCGTDIFGGGSGVCIPSMILGFTVNGNTVACQDSDNEKSRSCSSDDDCTKMDPNGGDKEY